MNASQWFNKLTRLVSNRLLNWGAKKSRRTLKADAPGRPDPQPRGGAKQTRQAVKHARHAARVTRRRK